MKKITKGFNLNEIKPPCNQQNMNCATKPSSELKNIKLCLTYFETKYEQDIQVKDTFKSVLDTIRPVVHLYIKGKEDDDEKEKAEINITFTDLENIASIIVMEVLEQASLLDLDIICVNSEFRQYNGRYYELLDVDDLTTFIIIAARKSGLNLLDSRITRFHTLVKKQVEISAKSHKKIERTESLINLGNGVICIGKDSYTFREHSKEDYFTYVLSFDYDVNATCPKFNKYLAEVLPNPDSRRTLCEYTGYTVAQNINLAKVLICIGSGRNGKSLYFKILASLLGKNNVTNFTLKELCDNPNARIQIENKLLNYSDEMSVNFDSTMFKMLVAGDPISGKILYKDIRYIETYAKLAFSTNEFPYNRDKTYGFYERFLFVNFDQTIAKNRRNPRLHDEIVLNELSGIFNWTLLGLIIILENNKFSESKNSDAVLETFKYENDNVLQFLEEKEYIKSKKNKRKLEDLYYEYKMFCDNNGFKNGSSKTLSKALKNKGFNVARAGSGGRTHVWIEWGKEVKEAVRNEIALANLYEQLLRESGL